MWRQARPKSAAVLLPATTHTWTARHLLLSGHVATAALRPVRRLLGWMWDIQQAGLVQSGRQTVILHPWEQTLSWPHFTNESSAVKRKVWKRSFYVCWVMSLSAFSYLSVTYSTASFMNHFPLWKEHLQPMSSTKAEEPSYGEIMGHFIVFRNILQIQYNSYL